MAISVAVVDGKIQETASSSSSLSKTGESGGSLGKDAFLQLLVTQMKYQDPLNPQDNSEYIAQLATFSQLEEMQNMSNTLQVSQASALTGETVIMKTKSTVTGELTYVTGTVDYVVIENSKAYLCIDDNKYSIDDLDTVIDSDFWEKYKEEIISGSLGSTTPGSGSTSDTATNGSATEDSTASDSATNGETDGTI